MPELPEVQTTVDGLKQVLEREIEDVWCDNEKMVGRPLKEFRQEVTGKTIKEARRRAKFILIDLSGNKTLLLHQRLTGHLLLGKWERQSPSAGRHPPQTAEKWKANSEALAQKVNGYLHLIFYLDNGQMLALSDLRKFATVELWDTKELESSERLGRLGPEPLSEDFDFETFKNCLQGRRAAVKTILMNQEVIAGIGNIYADEILWKAEIHPLVPVNELNEKELKRIFKAIESILTQALEKRGTSTADYRDLQGGKGHYQGKLKAYQRQGEPCPRCNATIKRIKVGGRSAHFCPQCQESRNK